MHSSFCLIRFSNHLLQVNGNQAIFQYQVIKYFLLLFPLPNWSAMHPVLFCKENISDLVKNSWLGLPNNYSAHSFDRHSFQLVLDDCFKNVLQALLAIFDSPLTKAGRLQAVYVRTEKGVLFEIKPHVRMPRTFKRFCGLMCKLLIILLYLLYLTCFCYFNNCADSDCN
jgi:hypothetical protein